MKMKTAQLTFTTICSIVLTTTMLSSSSAQSGTNTAYYCTEEASGGLQYDKVAKKWVGIGFNATHKFVLRLKFLRTFVRKRRNEVDHDETIGVYGVTITNAGESDESQCESEGNKEVFVGDNSLAFCRRGLIDYKINLEKNRYLAVYAIGFAVGWQSDEDSDTPYMEGGTCTKIE
jgi:hypothetical protein